MEGGVGGLGQGSGQALKWVDTGDFLGLEIGGKAPLGSFVMCVCKGSLHSHILCSCLFFHTCVSLLFSLIFPPTNSESYSNNFLLLALPSPWTMRSGGHGCHLFPSCPHCPSACDTQKMTLGDSQVIGKLKLMERGVERMPRSCLPFHSSCI